MSKTFIVIETIKCPCGKVLQVQIPVEAYGLSPDGVALQRDRERKVIVTEIKQD